MNKLPYFVIDYYDRITIQSIIDKYNMRPELAAREFLLSKTHAMLEDSDMGLWEFPEPAILDMWEAEKITGNPRNSKYIRGE